MPSADVSTLTPDELIGRIQATLQSQRVRSTYSDFALAPPPARRAAYALVVGAGFSHGVVPLVRELMHETIGDYYYPDLDQSSLRRPPDALRENAASFWAELNAALARAGLPPVEVDRAGLPTDPGAAYRLLFTDHGASALFALPNQPARGERFMKGFLRYVMDPGGEHGWGSTGRSELNGAHLFLAALLEAQQLGRAWGMLPFCRTLFTTNFDTLLQNALQMVNLLYRITDRPEQGLDPSDFTGEEEAIHLVYTHGSILRHNPASSVAELDGLSRRNAAALQGYLGSTDVIAIGYGGWNDGLMAALRQPGDRHLYWCDVRPAPPPHVASLLSARAGRAAYVCLGEGGADRLLRALYEALVPEQERRDPFQRYRAWSALTWAR